MEIWSSVVLIATGTNFNGQLSELVALTSRTLVAGNTTYNAPPLN
jgi:hypothetical protein